MLDNDITITQEEVSMSVAYIKGKMKELHDTKMRIDALGFAKSEADADLNSLEGYIVINSKAKVNE